MFFEIEHVFQNQTRTDLPNCRSYLFLLSNYNSILVEAFAESIYKKCHKVHSQDLIESFPITITKCWASCSKIDKYAERTCRRTVVVTARPPNYLITKSTFISAFYNDARFKWLVVLSQTIILWNIPRSFQIRTKTRDFNFHCSWPTAKNHHLFMMTLSLPISLTIAAYDILTCVIISS